MPDYYSWTCPVCHITISSGISQAWVDFWSGRHSISSEHRGEVAFQGGRKLYVEAALGALGALGVHGSSEDRRYDGADATITLHDGLSKLIPEERLLLTAADRKFLKEMKIAIEE